MSTGNISNTLYMLKKELKDIHCKEKIDSLAMLQASSSKFFLSVLNHACFRYSRFIARLINEKGYDLIGKDDATFISTVFKFLHNEIGLRSISLSPAQYISDSFLERKMLLTVAIIQGIKEKHQVHISLCLCLYKSI